VDLHAAASSSDTTNGTTSLRMDAFPRSIKKLRASWNGR
jgi:hypothetical protein